ncbi:diguanylate cyclase [Pelomicrobium sp. P1]|uniref:diguanylate cyclase n=1 Tax=Pelomicrobium sp. P1 TaxID=3463361 RepID=UPI003FDC0146
MSTSAADPAAIARSTLHRLAQQRLVPTPDNYARVYREIAGLPLEIDGWELLADWCTRLGREAPAAASQTDAVQKAIVTRSEPLVRTALQDLSAFIASHLNLDWAALVRHLLRQWDIPRKGLTPTRKRERLENVLAAHGGHAQELFRRIKELADAWARAPQGLEPAPAPAPPSDADGGELRHLLADTLERFAAFLETSSAASATQAKRLAEAVRQADRPLSADRLREQLRHLWLNVEMRLAEQAQRDELARRLLKLMADSLAESVQETPGLHQQMRALSQALEAPFDLPALAQAERALRDTIIRQGAVRRSVHESHQALKSMIALFIDRLGSLADETGQFHGQIERYAKRISGAADLDELGTILAEVLQDTRAMEASARRSHKELQEARRRAEEAEEKIRHLEAQLALAAENAREDSLTGALNRVGLAEAWHREAARADRHGAPLAVAMLDVDNFKQLNDAWGHQVGDEALRALAQTMRHSLRPTDVVARYGGEEFVLLFPETELEEAAKVLVRLQRELTKNIYLHDQRRPIVTFSAGVTLRRAGEDDNVVLGRADKALYQAKRAGKNRVAVLPPPQGDGP